jgi:hypothetical protein
MGGMSSEPCEPEPVASGRRGRACGERRTERAVRAALGWVRGAPGTHVWLAILGVTSAVIALASPGLRNELLHRSSTNLVELREHPWRVLVVSALWIETPGALLLYVPLFEVIHAPAERWLGTRRWLTTVGVAHVGATLLSQQAVLLGIRADRLPRSMAHTVDIGVSYGIAGVVGVLAYAVRGWWRWGYVAAVTAFFGWSAWRGRTFTDLGHFAALVLGLACYWLTRGARDGQDRPPLSGPGDDPPPSALVTPDGSRPVRTMP